VRSLAAGVIKIDPDRLKQSFFLVVEVTLYNEEYTPELSTRHVLDRLFVFLLSIATLASQQETH